MLPKDQTRRHGNRGSRFFQRYPMAGLRAANAYMIERRSASDAYRELLRDREELGIAAADLPSYETVRKFLVSIPADSLRVISVGSAS